MQNFILMIVEKFGYAGVWFLIAIENIFPPIPSEVILLFGGFVTTKTNLNIYLMVLFATLGSLTGALVLYLIGKFLNINRLKKVINSKVGKVIKLEERDIDKAYLWFEKRGQKAVFFSRFIPIVRSLISIPAGMSNMNFIKFVFYTVTATFIWNLILVKVGSIVGDNWISIANIMDKYSFVILVLLSIIIISFVLLFYYKRIKKNK